MFRIDHVGWQFAENHREKVDSGLQIEGVLAYFMHLKCQKHIGDIR
jgi:hypothetical protein